MTRAIFNSLTAPFATRLALGALVAGAALGSGACSCAKTAPPPPDPLGESYWAIQVDVGVRRERRSRSR